MHTLEQRCFKLKTTKSKEEKNCHLLGVEPGVVMETVVAVGVVACPAAAPGGDTEITQEKLSEINRQGLITHTLIFSIH